MVMKEQVVELLVYQYMDWFSTESTTGKDSQKKPPYHTFVPLAVLLAMLGDKMLKDVSKLSKIMAYKLNLMLNFFVLKIMEDFSVLIHVMNFKD